MPPDVDGMVASGRLYNDLDLYRSRLTGEEDDDDMGDVPLESAVDVPIDPNEPTYCLCNQVSFGAMIGCDNEEAIYSVSILMLTVDLVRN
jgi:hypothetical protein